MCLLNLLLGWGAILSIATLADWFGLCTTWWYWVCGHRDVWSLGLTDHMQLNRCLWISNDSNDTDFCIFIHCATPKSTSSSWEPSFLSLLVRGWLFQDHVWRSWSWGRKGIFLPSVWMHCCITITVLSYWSIHTHYITLLFAAVVVVAVVVAAVFAFLLIFSSGDRTW